ncbi:PAAR domain-containing protein [uncultured Massilia sp.]|uniref:PAAR domain-containing protein n=1 Tax=uncultured Massilia sp. TaxID=169973 RepID=UPI0025F004F8|nr:PAAR domain-containing protein [uncultured Massilia sp.]
MKQTYAADDSEPGQTSKPIDVGAATVARKVVARYPIATLGSRTDRGGEVVLASHDPHADDFRIACVGDRVRYPDGSESVIVSGAGHASTFADRPIALVGSHVANGDRIVARAQSMGEIVVYEGDAIPGLLDPGYALPARESGG